MIPFPQDINPHDVSQWAGGVHAWLVWKRPSGAMEICRLVETTPWPKVSVSVYNEEDWKVLPLDELYCHWPVCGMINHHVSKQCVYVGRRQNKQWCRTFKPSLCTITKIPSTAFWGHMIMKDMPHFSNHNFVREVFFPIYYEIDQAKKLIQEEGWTSVAIDHHVAISSIKSEYLIHFDDMTVGKLTDYGVITTSRKMHRRIAEALKL